MRPASDKEDTTLSKEKKTEVTEEVKEARELTEEELAQVSGGAGGSVQFFNEDNGFGVTIKPENGSRDIFAQPSSIELPGVQVVSSDTSRAPALG